MSLGEELAERVAGIFRDKWEVRDGHTVPDSDKIKLGNDAVRLEDAVVLYADLSGSTKLVDSSKWTFAAEVYKAFLYCAARIIASEGGTITAYDGDRIMAVYLGSAKNSSAARTALKINYCTTRVVTRLLNLQYPDASYQVRSVVGIDRSEIHAARTGVRGANDLVWVGRAANYAAKLSAFSDEYSSWITAAVYDRLNESLKSTDRRPMWERRTWTSMNNMAIYRSSWWLKVD